MSGYLRALDVTQGSFTPKRELSLKSMVDGPHSLFFPKWLQHSVLKGSGRTSQLPIQSRLLDHILRGILELVCLKRPLGS